jgi:GNAT superfamily N-acetyltransferase
VKPLLPRPIRRDDDVAGFDCGRPDLNSWLSNRALRSEKAGDSRAYVAVDAETGQVLGYYSLSAWTVAHRDIGGGWLKRNAPDPVSAVLLGRLGVQTTAQGLGLGRDLLADALRNAQAGAAVLGARALVAEALDEEAGRFYAHQGLWRSAVRENLFAAPLR